MSALGSSLSIDSHRLIPKPLALEAAGAVDGRLARDITLDRGLIEHAERDARGIDEFDCTGVAIAHHGDRGEKGQRATRAAAQLFDATRFRPRFAEDDFSAGAIRQGGGLIGADDASVGVTRGDRPSLGQGQSADQGECSPPDRGAFHRLAGRSTLKGVVHPRQKLAPVARGGC